MEQIKQSEVHIDPFIVEEIKKSLPKNEHFRPSDIIEVGGGYALEIKDQEGNREAIYYFNQQGKLMEMDAFKETLVKTSQGKDKVFILKNKGGRA